MAPPDVQASLAYDHQLAARYPQGLDKLADTPPTQVITLATGEPNPLNRAEVGDLALKVISRSAHASVSVSADGEVTVTAAKSDLLRVNEETTALQAGVARQLLHGDIIWLYVNPKKPLARLFPYRLALRQVRPLLVYVSADSEAAGAIEIDNQSTLADVRPRILEELDEDQLPAGVKDGTVQFYFQVDGVRVSAAQESRRNVWDGCNSVVVRPKLDGQTEPINSGSAATAQAAADARIIEGDPPTHASAASSPSPTKCATGAPAAKTASPEARIAAVEKAAATDAANAQNAEDVVAGAAADAQDESPQVQLPSQDRKARGNDDQQNMEQTKEQNQEQEQEQEQAQEASQVMLPSDSDLSEDDEEELAAIDLSLDGGDADQSDHAGVLQATGASASAASATIGNAENAAVHASMVRCAAVTTELRQLLAGPEVAKLAGEERRKQWLQKLDEMKTATLPETIVGVIGNTGVGKSSLLNALLGEASILPTSGSRGCTAAVVQLLYNTALAHTSSGAQVPVYEGVVEFISREEWEAELQILIDECSTAEGNIYTMAPSESLGSAENLLEAWQKIETVYGQGTLSRRCRDGISKQRMLQILKENSRVSRMLSQKFRVHAGSVRAGSEEAKALLLGATAVVSNKELKMKRSKWAKEFRSGINEFVYRRGNGSEPQDWPLIRQVTLKGPWPVLSAGAQLVDLPGVRDSNAARAKVAEAFLKNCNNVWIVAPIKRAVDDGTAKELMGDTFKRRLLMDGNYGNVAFICTQTDDVEPTEIWRDHRDVAQSKPGRDDRMQALFQELRACESRRTELADEKDEREEVVEDALIKLKRQMRRRKDAEEAHDNVLNPPTEDHGESSMMELTREQRALRRNGEQATDAVDQATATNEVPHSGGEQTNSPSEVDETAGEAGKKELLSQLAAEIGAATAEMEVVKREWKKVKRGLKDWLETTHGPLSEKVQKEVVRIQQLLKPLCAQVRNEYSTAQLQKDFKAGFADLTRQDAEEMEHDHDDDDNGSRVRPADEVDASTVEEKELDVFCISANDYLKVTKIKDRSDGPPVTFHNVHDTNIPQLTEFVHAITYRRRQMVAERLLESSSEFLSGVKLYLSNDGTADESLRAKTKQAFECELAKLNTALRDRTAALLRQMQHKIEQAIEPGMRKGAAEGQTAAKATAESWGSKDRRTKQDRGGGGLFWATYFASLRREGVFVSGSCGAIDMNQELSDPVEEKMMVGWDATMNSAMKALLEGFGASVESECERGNEAIATALALAGVNASRLGPIKQQASRALRGKIKDGVAKVLHHATERQREINRMMTPNIKEQMSPGYAAGVNAPGGTGRFERMKSAVMAHVSREFATMFAQATKLMLQDVHQLAKEVHAKAFALLGCFAPGESVGLPAGPEPVIAALHNLYSQFWEEQQAIDPAARQAAVVARKMTLPQLAKLEQELLSVMRENGMERLLGAVEKWQRDYDDASMKEAQQTPGEDGGEGRDKAVEIVGEVTAEQRTAAAKLAAVDLCNESSDSRKRQAGEVANDSRLKRPKLCLQEPADAEAERRSTLVGEHDADRAKRFKASAL